MRRASVLFLFVTTTLVASRELHGQCSGGNTTRVNSFVVTPTALTLPAATNTLFNAGWSQSSYSITVKPQGPNPWYLCVSSALPSMGTVSGYTKPLSDLQWSLDGVAWASFTSITLQFIRSNTGPETFTIYIRARLDYAKDVPQTNLAAGTYTANLTFSVSM